MTRFQRNKGQYVYSFLAWGGSKSRQLKSDFLVDNNNIKSAFVNRHVHPSKFFFPKRPNFTLYKIPRGLYAHQE